MSTSVDDALAAALAAARRQLGVPEKFPVEVLREAELAATATAVEPGGTLADLRDIEFLTIDPAGSTDLDQAVHLQRSSDGAILHYAIADVPAYVEPDGAIDHEARERGQTLYAPDGRVPLHPTVLSEDAASLLPDQDRRAFVWRFELDAKGVPTQTSLTRGVIRSRAQWSYVDAQAAIESGTAPETLMAMPWFGAERAAREIERGGASLNLPEVRIERDGDGYRLEIDEGVPLEDWNAHVSLLTGMAAARIMLDGGIGILRTMPPASPEDVAAFRAQTVALGMPWPDDVPYGAYLQSLDRGPVARAVKEHAAGLFRGAGYTTFDGDIPEVSEQAAIAAPYAHTTAPLRRLVDRWSLVVCDALANGREVPTWARESLPTIPDLMERSKQRVRQVEAGALDRIEAAVLHGREGDEFDAVVLRERGDGVRVALLDPPVEATLERATALPGTEVRVRLRRTSIADGVVEFEQVRG
ncbi:RNB domain-containing ribonuclease [Microbacterium sp. bgisy189]|uniref:RNB domain-containing ribonuclease n=1 Tax=Microbacterium sp. bgisy189 TaxID=3413798 RepID=UPI003EBAAF07